MIKRYEEKEVKTIEPTHKLTQKSITIPYIDS